jgi:hypothetical protein
MQDLSCAPALCTVHVCTSGNTGETIKRMQGTREDPEIPVIEMNSCEVRPTEGCNAIAQVFAFRSRLGGMISVNFDVSPSSFSSHILQ